MNEISLQELCCHLNDLLHVDEFSDYCHNGLQVEGKQSIRTVATAVSASLETIKQAVENKIDALIVHHGMFWKGDDYRVCGVRKEKLKLLLENEISLIGYHLPLDAHQLYGNNWKAAVDLKWINLKPCAYVNGQPIGVYGEFPPISREDFQKQIEEYYGHQATTAEGGKEMVNSVFLVSGGAYKMMHDATEMQADCFITGNFDEPAWHDAHEENINFYAMGHSATERVGPLALRDYIDSHFGITCDFIDVYNPF